MMSGEASVGPCASLTKPVMMEASSRKAQRPGIHRSRSALFMSMLAPFSVVLNWIREPKKEFSARYSALMYVHLHEHPHDSKHLHIYPAHASLGLQALPRILRM